jgi:RNA polymerase sigma-70 factor, ECF subfamily
MRAYQDMVFTTAARITGNDAQAQDIAQDVFLKAYDHFAQLRASATAGGWLKTVATRLALNHLSRYRKRWRFFSELQREDSDEPPEVDFPATEDVLANIDAQERHALIERALQQLPERQRVPVVLYHFEGLSYEQIARELGVSLAKVKTDIFRGRAALCLALRSEA